MPDAPRRVLLEHSFDRGDPAVRMPDGAVAVCHGTKWALPFLITEVGRSFPSLTVEQCHVGTVQDFRAAVGRDTWPVTKSHPGIRRGDPRRVVTYTYPTRDEIRAELAGRDLACCCDPLEPCHADTLLVVANDFEPELLRVSLAQMRETLEARR